MTLTRYPEGSVRELLSVSFPLILSSLSVLAMVFIDRIFLSRYSGAALSAGVTAGTASWAILGAFIILCSMVEIFVAQYNGAGHFQKIGRPVWQMIWFSFAMILVLVPLGMWGKILLFRGHNALLEREYFQWLTIFGFSWPLLGALSAFFVGRGKTRLIMLLAIFGNLINVLLDRVLIFGIEGVIPPLGVTGAAFATSFGNIIQIFVLFPLFLSSHNRETYGTAKFQFNFRELRRCLKVGIPQAANFFVELLGFAVFYMMIATTGPKEIYVASIAQSVLILLFFVAEGIGRGAAAVSGNFIGGQRHADVHKVFRSGLKLHIAFFAIASIFLVIFPEAVFYLFKINVHNTMEGAIHSLEIVLRICLFYVLFDGIRWLISGILASAGDTPFILIVGIISVPLTLLLPSYIILVRWGYGVEAAFSISIVFTLITATAFLWRFMSEKWQRIQLIP